MLKRGSVRRHATRSSEGTPRVHVQLPSAKGFPVPDFSPAVTFLELNSGTGELELLKACPLRGVDGSAVTGVSNNAGIDVPFTKDCGAALDTAPFGVPPPPVAMSALYWSGC